MKKVTASRLLYVLAILAVWQAATASRVVHTIVLPSPASVAQAFVSLYLGESRVENFDLHVSVTFLALLAAYAIVVVLGLPLGFGIGMSRFMWNTLNPVIFTLFSIPTVILYPLIFLLLGLGIASKIAFGAVVGIMPVITNTAAGVRQVKVEHIAVARSVGLNPFKTFAKVVFPEAAPSVVSGLRLGFSLTLAGVTVGEYIASSAGLGYAIASATERLLIPEVFAIFFLIVGISWLGARVLFSVEALVRRR